MITLDRLKELVDYDPATGVFVWRVPKGRARIGDVAGNSDNGYTRIRLDGRLYMAQVLAWLWVTGELPEQEIDHKDLNRNNNAWSNLRLATHGQNGSNSLIRSNNSSGYKGVTYSKRGKKWLARLMFEGNLYHLGYHLTARDAGQAYLDKSIELRGDFHRG